jgi:glycerophosphoryl diester phosphodiesterase
VAGPVLYAHRGAAIELPENTLPAFRRALEVGATALETDAHLTRDGHVVLAHDDDGARNAGVAKRIRDASLAELRAWNVGLFHPGAKGERFTMPTLEELLAETPGIPVNVDIKRHDGHAARAVIEVVRRMRAEARVLLTSFDGATVGMVRELGYEGPTGLARDEVLRLRFLPDRALALVPPRGRAAQIPTRAGPIALDGADFLARAHRMGLVVHYWTINDPREAERLLALGADGIMTDDPARIAPVFARYR